MGEVRKAGDQYYIEFYARGLLYQQKAGTDLAEAQKMLQEVEEKIRQGEMGTITRDVDIDIFIQTFLEQNKSAHTPQTLFRYRETLEHFSDFLTECVPSAEKLSSITPKVIELYREHLRKSSFKAYTANFTLFLLRNIFEFAIKLGYLNDNPTLHVKWLSLPKKRLPVPVRDEEACSVFQSLPESAKRLARTMKMTGLPLEELRKLKWTDFDFSHFLLKAAGRSIPLDPAFAKELQSLKREEGLVFDSTKLNNFNLDQRQQQLLRRRFIFNLIEHNVPLGQVYLMAGKDDIAKVFRYHPALRALMSN